MRPVYVAAVRRNVDYHHLDGADDPSTRCGRSTRTGEVVDQDTIVEERAARPCRRCYPDQVAA